MNTIRFNSRDVRAKRAGAVTEGARDVGRDGMSAGTVAKGEIRTCPNDGEPVIWTFKHPGHEYVCLICGWLGDVFGTPRSPATAALVARAVELHAQWDEQEGIRPQPPLPENPVCVGCGAVAPTPHKPPHWFTRTPKDSKPIYACSRGCINDKAMVAPW